MNGGTQLFEGAIHASVSNQADVAIASFWLKCAPFKQRIWIKCAPSNMEDKFKCFIIGHGSQ